MWWFFCLDGRCDIIWFLFVFGSVCLFIVMSLFFYCYELCYGYGLVYDFILFILGLCLIGWIFMFNVEGCFNLVFYSFFNIFNYWLFIVVFVSVGKKDSVCNVEVIGEFVYNLVMWVLVGQVNQSSLE